MSQSEIKVTDKRMFTSDGELREEYRFLESQQEREAPAAGAGEAPQVAEPPSVEPPEAPASQEGGVEDAAGPAFLDLVGMLAEPVPYYLGEVPLPNGTVRRDLKMARLHIDLLEVLRKKTAGNLTAEESSVLEDILYQLRMGIVQRGG